MSFLAATIKNFIEDTIINIAEKEDALVNDLIKASFTFNTPEDPMCELIKFTEKEWTAKGCELFGPDKLKWRFECPVCHNIQTPEDFHPYMANGARPDSAYYECIGRYLPRTETVSAFNDKSDGRPCDYAGYGFINLCPYEVTTELGYKTRIFAFADPDQKPVDTTQL